MSFTSDRKLEPYSKSFGKKEKASKAHYGETKEYNKVTYGNESERLPIGKTRMKRYKYISKVSTAKCKCIRE